MTILIKIVVAVVLVYPLFSDVMAAAYKCVDANGGVTYSQTPCPSSQTTEKKLDRNQSQGDTAACGYAGAFSKLAFRHMRSGMSTQQLFDSYGGVNALSRSTLGVINYVYSFKYAEDMRSDRVAQLTVAKCKSQAFGQVACEDFPEEFQEAIISCDEEEREEAIRVQKLLDQAVGQNRSNNQPGRANAAGSSQGNQDWQKAYRQGQLQREQRKKEDCKRRYTAELKRVEDRLRKGYSISVGESLRERRRSIKEKLRTDCL